MKTVNYLVIILFIALGFTACNNTNTKTKNKAVNNRVETKNLPQIKIDSDKSRLATGETIHFIFSYKNKIIADSVKLIFNNSIILKSDSLPESYSLELIGTHTGYQHFQIQSFKDSSTTFSSKDFVVLANNEPISYSYTVINQYNHDRSAYTQGLFYENNYLYEATGLKGESTLRKVDLESGQVLSSFAVPASIFGEGITAFHDKIVQLSWRSGIGFVYNKSDFKLLEQFNYSTEGWGITTDSSSLIMSDGTNNIYFLNPEDFSEIRRIQVFDNNKAVDLLNELEYIDGKIWANIYTTDKIAIINPEMGNVEAYINFNGLLDRKLYHSDTDVLNGIAYDKKHKRYFVTGKKWPLLFEIKLIKE